MSQKEPSVRGLLASAQHSAMHLEMRDAYSVANEADDFEVWTRTGQCDTDPTSGRRASWVEQIRRAVARGVTVRRARIVSEPVSDYIKYEHAGTVVNLAAGELVRWLPRRRASDLALPGNDLWIFDATTVLFNHFDGNGDWTEPRWELRTEPAVAQFVAFAFEAVWERAVPHDKFTV